LAPSLRAPVCHAALGRADGMDWMGSQQRDPWLRKATIKKGSISEGDWGENDFSKWMGMVIV